MTRPARLSVMSASASSIPLALLRRSLVAAGPRRSQSSPVGYRSVCVPIVPVSRWARCTLCTVATGSDSLRNQGVNRLSALHDEALRSPGSSLSFAYPNGACRSASSSSRSTVSAAQKPAHAKKPSAAPRRSTPARPSRVQAPHSLDGVAGQPQREIVIFRGPPRSRIWVYLVIGSATFLSGVAAATLIIEFLQFPPISFGGENDAPRLASLNTRILLAVLVSAGASCFVSLHRHTSGALLRASAHLLALRIAIHTPSCHASDPQCFMTFLPASRTITKLTLRPDAQQVVIRTAYPGLVGLLPRFLCVGPLGRVVRGAGFHLTPSIRERVRPLSLIHRTYNSPWVPDASLGSSAMSSAALRVTPRMALNYGYEIGGGKKPSRADCTSLPHFLWQRFRYSLRGKTQWEGVPPQERVEVVRGTGGAAPLRRVLEPKEPWFADRKAFHDLFPLAPERARR